MGRGEDVDAGCGADSPGKEGEVLRGTSDVALSWNIDLITAFSVRDGDSERGGGRGDVLLGGDSESFWSNLGDERSGERGDRDLSSAVGVGVVNLIRSSPSTSILNSSATRLVCLSSKATGFTISSTTSFTTDVSRLGSSCGSSSGEGVSIEISGGDSGDSCISSVVTVVVWGGEGVGTGRGTTSGNFESRGDGGVVIAVEVGEADTRLLPDLDLGDGEGDVDLDFSCVVVERERDREPEGEGVRGDTDVGGE